MSDGGAPRPPQGGSINCRRQVARCDTLPTRLRLLQMMMMMMMMMLWRKTDYDGMSQYQAVNYSA